MTSFENQKDRSRQTSKMKQFKLLPPLPPEAQNVTAPSRSQHRPSASEPSISLQDLHNARKVTKPVKPPSKAHVKSNSDSLLDPDSLSEAEALHSASKRNGKKPEHWGLLRSTVSSSTTLVSGGGGTGIGNHQSTWMPSSSSGIPAIPMVPPDMPVWQQQDVLQRPCSRSRSRRKPRGPPRDALSAEPEIDRALGPKSVPASMIDLPIGGLDSAEVQYSSAAELRRLWEAANGQRPELGNMPDGLFTLRFAR